MGDLQYRLALSLARPSSGYTSPSIRKTFISAILVMVPGEPGEANLRGLGCTRGSSDRQSCYSARAQNLRWALPSPARYGDWVIRRTQLLQISKLYRQMRFAIDDNSQSRKDLTEFGADEAAGAKTRACRGVGARTECQQLEAEEVE